MNKDTRLPRLTAIGIGLVGTLALGLALFAAPDEAHAKAAKVWRTVAKRLRTSVKAEAKADYQLALARAEALDGEDRDDALDEAKEEFKDEKSLAGDQYKARLELAEELEEDELYSVDIDPNDFVDFIDNPLLPYAVGNKWTYEAETEDDDDNPVTETIVVEVLADKKEILGVMCTVVRDTVSIEGELVEDTDDWFAQDKDGNVWYFGEISRNYEDGELVDVEGSWKSGTDGAQPGIVMFAMPVVGTVHRQEFLIGEAEDYGEVLALNESVSVPFGNYTGCLQTFDGSPMEPDAEEHKYYAPGVGLVLEENLEDDERVELIDFTQAP